MSQSAVHEAIDQLTRDTFPDVKVVYGNETEKEASQNKQPYLRQKVVFTHNNQAELTDRCFRRKLGYVLFHIHYPKGSGDAARNLLQPRIEGAFASRAVGAATMKDARLVSVAATENWELVTLQIPFYFDEVNH